MPNFRIIELNIDNQYFYVRRETEGSSTIDASGGYRSAHVIAHFHHMRASKTKPTRMDELASNAKHISVTILHRLQNTDKGAADAKKRQEVERLRMLYPGKVINVR